MCISRSLQQHHTLPPSPGKGKTRLGSTIDPRNPNNTEEWCAVLSNRIASNNIEILPARTVSTTRQSQTKAVAWFFPASFQWVECGDASMSRAKELEGLCKQQRAWKITNKLVSVESIEKHAKIFAFCLVHAGMYIWVRKSGFLW